MFVTNLSGQGLGFEMISALSGTGLTGLSGLISGYRTINGVRNGLSGNIIETAFGGYWANLFDWDTSGKIISYTFYGASGAIPVEKTVITTLNVSGQVYPASGINALVPPASLSGLVANSGLNATVPLSTLSGIRPISGTFVSVPIASISGAVVSSGLFVVGNSGLFVTVPVATLSGIQPISGTFVSVPTSSISGVNAAVSPANLSGLVVNSGLNVIAPITTISGVNVVVPVSTLSGIQPISGTIVSVPIVSISGVNAITAIQSGQIYLASGSQVTTVINLDKSGYAIGINLDKIGYSVSSISSGLLSGQQVTLISGQSYIASGINTIVPNSTLSGLVVNSGLTVSIPISVISGVNTIATANVQSGQVYLASGQAVNLNSGQNVLLYSGQLSGQPITGLSGYIYPASGVSVTAVANSGLFVSVPISTISGVSVIATTSIQSGQVFLASGSFLFGSGQFYVASGSVTAAVGSGLFVTVPTNTLSGVVPASGLFVTVPLSNISGVNAVVSPATLSGIQVGSGLFVNVPISTVSGINSIIPLSTLSGIQPISGTFVTVPSSTLSGVQSASGSVVTVLIDTISGINAVVPPSTLSGIQPISGSYVTIPTSTLSGVIANSGLFVTANAIIQSGQVYLASGQAVNLNSGQEVVIYSGQLSGQPTTPSSGMYVVAGQVLDKSGYTLTSGGLDTIPVEVGMNMRQAQSIQTAALAGQLSGVGTASITIGGANITNTTRINATVNQSGDRINVLLTLPT